MHTPDHPCAPKSAKQAMPWERRLAKARRRVEQKMRDRQDVDQSEAFEERTNDKEGDDDLLAQGETRSF